ncbi:amidase [Nocardioides carbamazepini]|uniref:amidase n=1 Tax=Nocardioides carbamazepini TaxID=2854259 RepID=UPI00214A7382|nr:amidase [Nocardioides carbamazepini]MCR1784850.1 amidase [Nocardioides carbamazepini]
MNQTSSGPMSAQAGDPTGRSRRRVRRRLVAAGVALSAGAALVSGGPLAQANEDPTQAVGPSTFDVNEATIADIAAALESGTLTSVELTAIYLNRAAKYDRGGINLNSIVVENGAVLEEAAQMDALRAAGTVRGPLHGIPFTVKDSYKVAGLTVASGSPAFKDLVADEDAFAVAKIRESGGLLIGKTNMPPIANGGMQRGVYGRAESPYNPQYLTAAWGSGSSNGSGTSTTANFATFGMGEETVSSGRSPASNNGLIAYTPSRGLLSIRGNAPLWPTRDVIVPHTRTVEDTMTVLDVIAKKDARPDGDFWLTQPFVDLPDIEDVRPESYLDLKDTAALEGKRIGVPRMYLNKDVETTTPIDTRPSVIDLWERTADDLRAQGAEVVEVDFPLVENYFEDRPGAESMYTRGYVPAAWRSLETGDYASFWMEKFLKSNNDPAYPSWTAVDPATVFPYPSRLPANPAATANSYANRIEAIRTRMPSDLFAVEGLGDTIEGWNRTREEDFDSWLVENDLDLLAFPAVADIGKADADINVASNTAAHRYGVGRSATDHVMRVFGLPSVSVPMGLLADIEMPMNVTFVGTPYTDNDLLSIAYDYEQATHNQVPAPRTPALPQDVVTLATDDAQRPENRGDVVAPALGVDVQKVDWTGPTPRLAVTVTTSDASGIDDLWLTANGDELTLTETAPGTYQGTIFMDRYQYGGDTGARSVRLVALAKDTARNAAAFTDAVKVPVPFTDAPVVKPGGEDPVKTDSSISVTKLKKKVKVGKRATLSVTVASPAGVPTGTVRVKAFGKKAKVRSLANGTSTVRLPRFKTTGTRTVQLLYGGDATTLASATIITLRVVR